MIDKAFILSNNVYGDTGNCNSAFGELKRLKSSNDYCEVVKGINELFIVFRGSDDIKDWIENVDIDNPRETYEDFKEQIVKEVKKNIQKEILITGHSRGGWIATYCAEHLSMIKPVSCITFGSPRQGTKEFRNNYNKLPIDHTNVINGWDQVSYLPLFVMGYRRVGKDFKLKKPFYWRLAYFRLKAHTRKEYQKSLRKRN